MPDKLVDRSQRVIRNLTGKPVEEIPLENDPSTTVAPERRAADLLALQRQVDTISDRIVRHLVRRAADKAVERRPFIRLGPRP
jgi:hypothetical protein